MGFFSKSRHSKKNNDDDALILPEEAVPELQYKVNSGKEFAHAPHALTAKEVLEDLSATGTKKVQNIEMKGGTSPVTPLDKLRRKVAETSSAKPEEKEVPKATSQSSQPVTATPSYNLRPSSKTENADVSLLEKCMPFLIDGGNKVPEEKPEYTLESVESIINLTEKKFAKIFDELEIDRSNVTYDGLSKTATPPVAPQVVPPVIKPETPIVVTEIPMKRVEPEITTISDIDGDSDFTKTVNFAPVTAPREFEDISSGTKILNLSSEMFDEEYESDKIESLPFVDDENDFVVEDDYVSPENLKTVVKKLVIKRRNAFLRAFVSILLTGIMALALIPDLKLALLATPTPFYITSTIFFAVMLLVNFDALLSLKTLFTPRKRPESLVGIAGIALVVYSVVALLSDVNPFDILFTGAVFLSFKAVAMFMHWSTVIGNFKVIAGKNDKYGIKFIDDKQTTFAMARNSIEGDVLVASSLKTKNIHNFLKNSYSDSAFNGGLGKLAVAALCVTLVISIVIAIKDASLVTFFEFFATGALISFAPTVLFTDILPLRRASKRLNSLGAMITGVKAAKKLDLANALTITSSQLFPDGTLSLHNMKILDENEIDETLIDAAAITGAIGSPLKGIFNTIAKSTPVNIPEADTIKYEERLGISGWIKDRRVFIGNRTLLEAHGISTPPIEVDRKILRQGYFPVYLASGGKPCALLMVKYNVKRDIAVRLQRLSNTGITFLVDSCDPNITNEMVCDYFGIYPESVRVMGGLGCQLNKNITEYQEDFPSVAAHKGSLPAVAEMFIAAEKIKKSVSALTVFHIVSSAATLLYFIYSAVLGTVMPLGNLTVLVSTFISLVISGLVYLINRP